MPESENNAPDTFFNHVRFISIVILLIITIVFIALNRFYPSNTVDKQTIDKMNQIVAQFQDISTNIHESADIISKSNQNINKLLSQRGVDRENLYQNMLDQYGGDASRLRPPPDDIGSEHPTNR